MSFAGSGARHTGSAAPPPPVAPPRLWSRTGGRPGPPPRSAFPSRRAPSAFAPPSIAEEEPPRDKAEARSSITSTSSTRSRDGRRESAPAAPLPRWRVWASYAIACHLAILLFALDTVGATARARLIYASVIARAAAMRERFAEQLAAGAQLTRKLSSAALETLNRGMSSSEKVANLLRRAMSHEGRLDTVSAIRCYQAASDLVPDDPEPLVGLAKCISDRVFEPAISSNSDLARSMALQAAYLSQRAIELKPDNPRAHLAAAVALGRLALWSSNQKKIEISRTVRERVASALALSPDDDVALHVLGRWEYEMSCVGFAVRVAVKMMYGGLEVGSIDAAHRCLARAIELRPERLVHRVVMARILLKQNRNDEAVVELQTALGLGIEDVNAELERAEATRMLGKLGKHVKKAVPAPAAEVCPPLRPSVRPPMEPVPVSRTSSLDFGRRLDALPSRSSRSEDGSEWLAQRQLPPALSAAPA